MQVFPSEKYCFFVSTDKEYNEMLIWIAKEHPDCCIHKTKEMILVGSTVNTSLQGHLCFFFASNYLVLLDFIAKWP